MIDIKKLKKMGVYKYVNECSEELSKLELICIIKNLDDAIFKFLTEISYFPRYDMKDIYKNTVKGIRKEFRERTKTTYEIIMGEDVLDRFDTMEEAKLMLEEYKLAYHRDDITIRWLKHERGKYKYEYSEK